MGSPDRNTGSTIGMTSLECMYVAGSRNGSCLGGGLHTASTPVIALLRLTATPGIYSVFYSDQTQN